MKNVLLIAVFLGMSAVSLQSCSESAKQSESATVMYECPMKCEGDKKHTEKGNCSVCGMELTAVE